MVWLAFSPDTSFMSLSTLASTKPAGNSARDKEDCGLITSRTQSRSNIAMSDSKNCRPLESLKGETYTKLARFMSWGNHTDLRVIYRSQSRLMR
jgi:hypothetical protein